MIFSSKTPRDLNRDPEPWTDARGENRHGPFGGWSSVWAPRPEFDHAQHNEPNPILAAFRRDAEEMGRERGWDTGTTARSWDRDAFDSFVDMYPTEALDHASAVIERLANITKEN